MVHPSGGTPKAGQHKWDTMVEGWQEVPVRRNKGRQNMKRESKGMGDTTKFYISNIPTGCNPWEMSKFLGSFGEVVGSYIARKRDK